MATPMLRAELLLVAGCLVVGGLVALAYECLLLFRLLVRHRAFFLWVEDLLFFVLAGLLAFATIFQLGDGVVRYYAAGSLAGGALICIKIVKFLQNRLKMRRYRRRIKKPRNTEESNEGGAKWRRGKNARRQT